VLHMTSSPARVAQRRYRSHPQITQSDHRPVSAAFDFSVRVSMSLSAWPEPDVRARQLPTIDTRAHHAALAAACHVTAKMEDAEEPPALELGAADVALGKVV
jgi:hypothetical protein